MILLTLTRKAIFSIIFFLFSTYYFLCFSDGPENWQMGIQDPATPMMEGIINFHNFLLCIIVTIGVTISILIIEAVYKFRMHGMARAEKFAHASILEIVWTIIPALILLFIAGPSFTLLYALDECSSQVLVIRVIGHQWYWTYEIPEIAHKDEYLAFDSYMVTLYNLEWARFRLLEVDNRLILPVNVHISFIITSADVIHSWAVPSFGVKIDACPGRLAHVTLFFQREGCFYGQCSEICGTGHGFMPIVVRVLSVDEFEFWIQEYLPAFVAQL